MEIFNPFKIEVCFFFEISNSSEDLQRTRRRTQSERSLIFSFQIFKFVDLPKTPLTNRSLLFQRSFHKLVRNGSLTNENLKLTVERQDTTNGDELDQKNNNRADLNEIKLTVKDDGQQQRPFAQDGAVSLQVHQNAAQLRPAESLTTGQAANQSNSLTSNGSVDGRQLYNSATVDHPDSGQNGRSDSNADQQSLPPAYFEVPGIVPFMAASSNQPPPSYEEVRLWQIRSASSFAVTICSLICNSPP